MEILNESNFNEAIKEKVLIDFYADWCGPCKMLSEVFDEVKNELKVDVKKVNVDDCQNIAREYGIMSIPTIVLFENGNVVKKHTGFLNAEELIDFTNGK